MRFEGHQCDLKVEVGTHYEGLRWLFTNERTGETLSVICHSGSHGVRTGMFEILPSWRNPNPIPENIDLRFYYRDVVKGHMSFGDVQEWINELADRIGG